MTIMRHSDAKLLHRIYADPSAFTSSASLDKLPRFDQPGGHEKPSFGVGGWVDSAMSGDVRGMADVSSSVNHVDSIKQQKTPDISGVLSRSAVLRFDLSASVKSWGTRIRIVQDGRDLPSEIQSMSADRSLPCQPMPAELKLIVERWESLKPSLRAALLAIVLASDESR